ncbi:MAG: hypothetical protein KDK70_34560, partial [Myxococcales bacterium]|nr:hypothetical protein [Myxococcales bacterium]
QVLARLDGTIGGSPSVLEVDYQQRYVVDVLGGQLDFDELGDSTVLESIDCRERVFMELTWSGPLPDPEIEPRN